MDDKIDKTRKLKPESECKVDELFDIIVEFAYQYGEDDEWYYSILNHIRYMRYKRGTKKSNGSANEQEKIKDYSEKK